MSELCCEPGMVLEGCVCSVLRLQENDAPKCTGTDCQSVIVAKMSEMPCLGLGIVDIEVLQDLVIGH